MALAAAMRAARGFLRRLSALLLDGAFFVFFLTLSREHFADSVRSRLLFSNPRRLERMSAIIVGFLLYLTMTGPILMPESM